MSKSEGEVVRGEVYLVERAWGARRPDRFSQKEWNSSDHRQPFGCSLARNYAWRPDDSVKKNGFFWRKTDTTSPVCNNFFPSYLLLTAIYCLPVGEFVFVFLAVVVHCASPRCYSSDVHTPFHDNIYLISDNPLYWCFRSEKELRECGIILGNTTFSRDFATTSAHTLDTEFCQTKSTC